jgi:hypothetical protein
LRVELLLLLRSARVVEGVSLLLLWHLHLLHLHLLHLRLLLHLVRVSICVSILLLLYRLLVLGCGHAWGHTSVHTWGHTGVHTWRHACGGAIYITRVSE